MTYTQGLEALKTAAGSKLQWAIDNHCDSLKIMIKGTTDIVVLRFTHGTNTYNIFTLFGLTSENSNYVYSVNLTKNGTGSKFMTSVLSYNSGGTAVISISNISSNTVLSSLAGTWELVY